MTMPNPNTITAARKGRRSQIGWIVLVVFIIGLFVLVAVVRNNNNDTYHRMRYGAKDARKILSFPFETLEQEDVFRQTLKECLPQENDHCKQYIPPGTTDQRIALLSPPGELATFLETFVKKHALENDLEGLHVELTPHIPPYGYGKTHGWTKLIRLVPTPLSIGAVDALHAVIDITPEEQIDVQHSDIRSSLRQVIRWHCRVSHISAHTSVLTLYMDQIMKDPSIALDAVVSFVRTTPNKKVISDSFHQSSSSSSEMNEMIRTELGLVKVRVQAFMEPWLLKWDDGLTTTTSSQIFNTVLSKELASSKNLSVWPCPSLWSTAGDDDDENEALSPDSLPARLAKQLVPDCNDSFAQCWVDRDKCESRGDAVCKKQ